MTVTELVVAINKVILSPLITLLLAVALLIFLWGVFQYVVNADNEQARSTGQKHMLWGIIGMTIMVSALAILNIALATFSIGTVSPAG